MPDPTAEAIAGWIEQDATNLEFLPIRDVIESVLIVRLTRLSPEAASELAERMLSAVTVRLENRIAENRADGVVAQIEVYTDFSDAYIKALDVPEQRLLLRLRELDPTEFESFCARILSNLGANALVTGGSNDRGVDFVADGLQLGGNIDPSPISSRAIVVGQAKRYAAGYNIAETDLRMFIGGAILHAERLRRDRAGLLTPVVYAYWTTSDFHFLARRYARDMGIWYLKGTGLAQLALRVGLQIP